MAKKKRDYKSCFYCGALCSAGNFEMDHFPVPECAGGEFTVPACVSCHDMKDRFSLDSWSDEWRSALHRDFHMIPRECRIFLAKCFRIAYEANAFMKKHENA
jgi:hypothetical protein